MLDVATGPAPLLAALAGRSERPVEAIGIDSSAEMLALAPDLPPGWELRRGDATALPFPAGSFDVVTASYLLHFLPVETRRAVIAEIARVLRPEGRVGTITVAPPHSLTGRVLAAPLIAAANRADGSLASLRPFDPRLELEAAGFAGARARRTLLGYPSLCVVADRLP